MSPALHGFSGQFWLTCSMHPEPQQTQRHARGPIRRGLSLIEVALSILILSFIAVAAARTVASARAADQLAVDRLQAQQLAEELLSRVMVHPYEDPSPGLLGLELGETLGTTSTYDDIDDWDGYGENPVKDAAGTNISGLSAWSRRVNISWVESTNFTRGSLTETGCKRVTVQVRKNGREILTAVGYKSKGRTAAGG